MEDDFQAVILPVFFIFVALNINVRSIFLQFIPDLFK